MWIKETFFSKILWAESFTGLYKTHSAKRMAVWLAHHPSASQAFVTLILRPSSPFPPMATVRPLPTPPLPRPGLCPDEQPPLGPPPGDEPQPAPRAGVCRRQSLHLYAPVNFLRRPRRSGLSHSHRAARVLRACLKSRFYIFFLPLCYDEQWNAAIVCENV